MAESEFDQQGGADNSPRDKASAAAKDIGRQASSAVKDAKKTATSAANYLTDAASDAASQVKQQAGGLAEDLKQRASQHAGDARDLVSNIATEAKSKVSEMVDQQKNAGADKLTGLSRAAHNAAGELEQQSPQVAQLVRDAASTVDNFADDLRTSSLSDVVASISSFARKQPVAFFAASVLAGFVLARFVKSEPASIEPEPRPRRSARR